MEQSLDYECHHGDFADRAGRDGARPAARPRHPAGHVSGVTMTDRFISIEGITRRFPAAGGGETPVFEDLWLSIQRGEFVCIIGHSGCGKTTVLNILAGLDDPSEGVVIVDGQGIEGTSLDRAVIFQSHALLPWRTVLGNVSYAVTSKWRRWDQARVRAHSQ